MPVADARVRSLAWPVDRVDEVVEALARRSQGAAGWLGVASLAGWSLVAALIGGRYLALRSRWTDQRLAMTHDLVGNMVGHLTRLAQEERGDWHRREDRLLEGYLVESRSMGRQRALLSLIPRGWMVVGIGGVLPAFAVARSSVAALAVAIGGVLLAFRAFAKLSTGFARLAGAWVSWRHAAPIFHAAARAEERPAAPVARDPAARDPAARGPDEVSEAPSGSRPSRPCLEAQDVVFRHRQRARPVLEEVSLPSAPETACCSKDPPAAASRPSPRSSPVCGGRIPASCCSTGSTVSQSIRPTGAAMWCRRRSSTRTTSSPRPSPSTC